MTPLVPIWFCWSVADEGNDLPVSWYVVHELLRARYGPLTEDDADDLLQKILRN